MRKPQPIPPRWLTHFFSWLCRPADIDDLLGDIEEIYRENLNQMSHGRANLKYLGQCLVLVFSYTVKKRKAQASFKSQKWSTQNIKTMYYNYLKMVFRRFRTRLTFSLINVFGLGVGLASCFIITLYLKTEYSYDRFHEDYDLVYRLTKSYPANGIVETTELRNHFLPIIAETNPAVNSYCRLKNQPAGVLIHAQETVVKEKNVAFADPNFFEFFSFDLLAGSRERLLIEPYTAAISRRLAEKYFAKGQVLGEVMSISFPKDGRKLDLKIMGIFEDMPVNSHMHKDIIISAKTGEAEEQAGHGIRAFHIQHNYFRLAEGYSINAVDEQIPEIIDQHAPGFFKRLNMELKTQAMADIHLRSNMEREFEANGSEQYLDLLKILAVFIMIMAAFNYTNLATSQSLDRAKEVGVRKVLGSGRQLLAARFIVEAVTISGLGLLLATFIVVLTLPYFEQLSGSALSFEYQTHWPMLLYFVCAAVVVGLVAGFYPAVYMAGFKPVNSLKGKLTGSGKTAKLIRKTLVVGQFAISAALMVGAGVVYKQFRYMVDRELGISTETIVNIDVSSEEASHSLDQLKQNLGSIPQVSAVSASASAPVTNFDLRATNGIYLPGSTEEHSMNYLLVDRDFFLLYEIEMLIGQHYGEFEGEALSGIVLNRTAMEKLGFNEQNVIGQQVEVYDGYHPRVIGVTENFHFESLHQSIGPLYFQWIAHSPDRFDVLSVKLSGEDLAGTLTAIEKAYSSLIPTNPLSYEFLDDRIERAYENEAYFLNTFTLFTALAVLIAGIGALGLAMQLTVSRQKEMGVRKILGAKVGTITFLLSREMLLLVTLANLVAWPVTYLLMSQWLDNFPYKYEMGVGVFLVTLLASALVSMLSIGGTSLRVALSNPVNTLRNE